MNFVRYPDNKPKPNRLHLIITSTGECFISDEIREGYWIVEEIGHGIPMDNVPFFMEIVPPEGIEILK